MNWTETRNSNVNIKNVKLGANVTILDNVNIEASKVDSVQIGKYSIIKENSTIRLPSNGVSNIGAYVIIGNNCDIRSLNIGNRVMIEDGCVLNDGCVIYECCLIKSNCIIPSKMIIPAYCEVGGVPGKDFYIKPLNSSFKKVIEYEAKYLNIHY
ncbi:unnamed protein product [Candida verbasci]|uniref:Dynactin subunit 5 n=1 Tax=Candida verbasci TaxID=1227364 RepID=A0A9W4XM98_9ASCO|nr:unnamed protein product [Candida verbasci]